MELKNYQINVLNDLRHFLELLTEKQNIRQAYHTLWQEKGVTVGTEIMPSYHTVLPGVPHVCIKVPTGGGKTFLAANAVKPIFDSMPHIHPLAVAWMVPSDAILQQTVRALQNPQHDYRKKINADFSGNVEVYTKEQLLNGQNFNPVSVGENLSIFVLSYDSFRTSKKEGRKAYQENGYLASFKEYKAETDVLLKDADETALIQVIRKLNPIVIVDESHHASSNLSVEMLNNFNPSFVLELTATPKQSSNIISIVDAKQLKKEEMVKLPVIVYNRRTQEEVFLSAISLRQKLEYQAEQREKEGGTYIRPIVLFQAEPKHKNDSTTYEKIKNSLIEIGIPQEQIAIKTGDKDELKNQNLMSKECNIRYIITVNALKEGWDCPFAYILATVANGSSVVDVEQILGRVLRMPYAKASKKDVLNLSYVITSSSDFLTTCEQVVKGLNSAGFSRKDYRILEEAEQRNEAQSTQISWKSDSNQDLDFPDDIDDMNTEAMRQQLERAFQPEPFVRVDDKATETQNKDETDEMLLQAEEQNHMYWEGMNQDVDSVLDGIPEEHYAKI